NANVEYSYDPSTSHEKEDIDNITVPLARVGALLKDTVVNEAPLEVNFGTDKAGAQGVGSNITLMAEAYNGSGSYSYEFKVNGTTVSNSANAEYQWTPTEKGNYTIGCVLTDTSTGKTASSTRQITIGDEPVPVTTPPTQATQPTTEKTEPTTTPQPSNTTFNGKPVKVGDKVTVTGYVKVDNRCKDFDVRINYGTRNNNPQGISLESYTCSESKGSVFCVDSIYGEIRYNGVSYSDPYDFTAGTEIVKATFIIKEANADYFADCVMYILTGADGTYYATNGVMETPFIWIGSTDVVPAATTAPTEPTTEKTEPTSESSEPTTETTESSSETEPVESSSETEPAPVFDYYVVGSPELFGANWAEDPANGMTKGDDEIYHLTIENAPAGTFGFKVKDSNGGWHPDGMGNDGSVTTTGGETVIFSYDPSVGFAIVSVDGEIPTYPATTAPTDETKPTETEPKPTETEPTCAHSKTTTTGKKTATYFEKGYTGDKVCADCGEVIVKGSKVAKKVLKTPKVTVKPAKNAIKVTYKKVKDAKGFKVTYKIGKKTYTKKYTLTKKELKKAKVTKTIKVKKSGKYKVTVKAFVTSGKKTAYSNPTKTAKVKIK
ncbi:MAG: hypothetical protein ACI4RM_08180, partial [Ruminococcus sp.]